MSKNYQSFELDWWDDVGVTADAVKAAIANIIDQQFGPGGIPAIERQALIDAAFEQYRSQQSIKLAAAAAKEAAQYADVPDSPLYKNAMATVAANERIASTASNTASQIMDDAVTTATKMKWITGVANNLGPCINIVQLGAAAATGDAYEVGQKAVEVLAGMAVGALAIATAATLGAPIFIAGLVGIGVGLAASKFWRWCWENGAADFYGIKKGDEFSISRTISSALELFGSAITVVRRDPLILDLDGDGLETVDNKSGAYFDHDGNGFAEQTGWVGSDDGLLVMDRDGDGIIENGGELFGDQTILQNGQKATDGFQALAEWDSNADGKIDIDDAVWSQLKIWQDFDGDGYSSPDELFSLDEAGVKAINLNHTDTSTPDGNGNTLIQQGTFVRSDDTTGSLGGYELERDVTYTIANAWLDVSEDIAELPDLQGYGNVHDLHQAMARDTTGQLQSLVEQFMAATDVAARNSLMEQ